MRWPDEFKPEVSAVFGHNDIAIPAEPERVWKWLIRAELWPTWYPNCGWVRMEGRDLAPGVKFTWKTFGVVVESQVIVFEPPHALEWNGIAIGTRTYHGWTLESRDGGTFLVTEETQNGFLPGLLRGALKANMLKGHQQWVETLKKVSLQGDPS